MHPEAAPDSDTPSDTAVIQPDTSSKDVVTPPPPDTGNPHDTSSAEKTDFDLCSADSECASGLCRAMYEGGATRSTRACTTTTDCMEGTRCVTVGSTDYCVMSDIGRACTTGTGTCNFACLTSQQYCTMPCVDGSDCAPSRRARPTGPTPHAP